MQNMGGNAAKSAFGEHRDHRAYRRARIVAEATWDAWGCYFGKFDTRNVIFANPADAKIYFGVIKSEIARLVEKFG